MAKQTKKILALILSVILMCSVVSTMNVLAVNVVESGKCGENLTWTLDSEGTLTISGEGEMEDHPGFWNYPSIKSVIIENGVTSIGGDAFYSCTNLINITIPDSVTTIGESAFQNCENLASVNLGNSVTTIGKWAFSGCTNLTSIKISDSVTTINDVAFYGCENLESINVPDSVITIGKNVFMFCNSLESIEVNENNPNYSSKDGILFDKNKTELIQYPIGSKRNSYTIPNGVKTIDDYAFLDCKFLENIMIPDSVTIIGDNAFESCINLKSVTIGSCVTVIGENAFHLCEKLSTIMIPDSVNYIGNWAFLYAGESIEVNENNPNYSSEDGVLFNKDKTELIQYPSKNKRTTYTIPNSVTTIDDYAFSSCYNLVSVTIGNCVENIGEYTFEFCSKITSVKISNSVKTISHRAFFYCESLTNVYYDGSKAEWNAIKIDNEEDGNHYFLNATIHFADEPTNPTTPDEPQNTSFFEKIVNFFNRIIDWFKNLFKIK